MKLLLVSLLLTSASFAQTLESQLQAKQQASATKSDPDTKIAYAAGIQAVKDSGIEKQAVHVGEKAPDFMLKNAKGEDVALSTLLKDGPIVLTWYRGGWCPYCNITLAALQKALPDIKAAGAQLVALTPELPDKSLTTIEKNVLKFQVLTDLNHEVAKRYRVAFELTPDVASRYKKHFDLLEFNGADAGETTLPLAATYIIDREGMVRFAFLNADYRKRAEPAEIVAFLQKMAAIKE